MKELTPLLTLSSLLYLFLRPIIKTEKIAVIHNSIVKKKLGSLPDDIFALVKEKLRKTLNI